MLSSTTFSGRRGLRGTAGFDFLFEVAVGGRKDAGVGLEFGVGADPVESALLRHAEQLGLERGRHVGDFIQEDGSAVGLLEAANPLCHRPGKAALFVPKKLALEEGFRNSGTVYLTSGPAERLLRRG